MDAVEFDVSYRFSEYRQFAIEYVGEERGRTPGPFGRTFISAIAAITFAVKKSRMPLCSFRIDEAGIRRRTGGGELPIPWGKVSRVFRYQPGYLIELGRGALPIPYRCLTPAQRDRLEKLVNEKTPAASPITRR